MIINEKKTITDLTADTVSIKTESYIDLNGVETKVGSLHRVAYSNSVTGRKALESEQPEEVSAAVLAFWGADTTVDEPAIEKQSEEDAEETQNTAETDETEVTEEGGSDE